MAVEHLSKKFPRIYEKRRTTPTLFHLFLLYSKVDRRSPGWHGPKSPSRAPTGRGPGAATPAGLPQGRPAHSETLGGAAWTRRLTLLRVPPSSEPPRPSVGAHNTRAAWPTGFTGWKLSAEQRCAAASSRLTPSPSDRSGRASTSRSGIRVPKEPELQARRLFFPPPPSCPGARGDFAHCCTVAAFGRTQRAKPGQPSGPPGQISRSGPSLRPPAPTGNQLLNPTPRVGVGWEPLSLFRKSWGQRLSPGALWSVSRLAPALHLARWGGGVGRQPTCASCGEWGAGGTESLLERQCPTSAGRRCGSGAEVTWCPRAGPAEAGLSLLTIPPPILTVGSSSI